MKTEKCYSSNPPSRPFRKLGHPKPPASSGPTSVNGSGPNKASILLTDGMDWFLIGVSLLDYAPPRSGFVILDTERIRLFNFYNKGNTTCLSHSPAMNDS